jgi:hypothetical protein
VKQAITDTQKEQQMTVDDALKAMSAIESQRDGSEAKTVIVQALNRKLLEDPENFWGFYLETLNAAHLNPYSALAERLLRGGAVSEATTIGEIASPETRESSILLMARVRRDIYCLAAKLGASAGV